MRVVMNGDGRIVRVERPEDLPRTLREMGLDPYRRVLVSVGGASGMSQEQLQTLSDFLTTHLVPALDRWDTAVVDGGTDAGLMGAMGRARRAAAARFPLIGVAAEGTLVLPGDAEPSGDVAALEPNHTHTLVVPGLSWGDESPWLSDVASALSGVEGSVTLLVNGGEISYDDADRSLRAGRPLLVLDGTGRTADLIGAAARGQGGDPRARAIAASPLTRVLPLARPEAVIVAVGDALGITEGETP
jgi:hypothetical protein